MPPPKLPLELLLDIAQLLTDADGKLCFADFNSFLKVNRTLYACLNRTIWQKAVESEPTTKCVFKHLLYTNYIASLKFFLELGVDVETVLDDSDSTANGTPLQVAAQLDNVPMARLLLEHGADTAKYITHGRLSGSVPLHVARSGQMVQLLLDHHADPEQPKLDSGDRPLHCYALRNDIEAMRAILRNGAEVDSKDGGKGFTPLHCAVRNINAVKVLLEHGADAKNTTDRWNTTLHLAVIAENIEVVTLLLERCPKAMRQRNTCGNTPLLSAAKSGKTAMVSLLLERWPDSIRVPNAWGKTPLHLAAKSGKTAVVRLLLERWPEGVRVMTPICWRQTPQTPLQIAVTAGKTDVVRLMLQCWPEGVRVKNGYGETLLHLAASCGTADMVRLLVESWPDGRETLDNHGRTPFSRFEESTWSLDPVLNIPERKKVIDLLSGM